MGNKNPFPQVQDDFKNKLKVYEDRNEMVTDEVCHMVYSDVLGPEKRNYVRGFGAGVCWSDVLGIRTEGRGISKEVLALRTSYEEQREAAHQANNEIERLRMEVVEREERQRIQSRNEVAQLRKKQVDSMETMKREMMAGFMSLFKKDSGNIGRRMAELNGVDVIQAWLKKVEIGIGTIGQESRDFEDDGFAVLGMDDDNGYRPCMRELPPLVPK